MKKRRKLIRTPEGNANRRRSRMARLDALVAKMYVYYQSGHTLAEVGAKYGGRECTGIYSLFKGRGLPRRKKHFQRSHDKGGLSFRAHLDALVAKMYADYQRPMSLGAVGRKYGGRSGAAVSSLFKVRGLAVRPNKFQNHAPRDAHGTYLRRPPLTLRQIDKLIDGSTKICRPVELRPDWTRWTLEKRRWFIARMRRRLKIPGTRPKTPYSANVEPFDYTTPRAQEIIRLQNAGLTSHKFKAKIYVSSEGVIYQDRLYFWAADRSCGDQGAYYIGPWRPGVGRPALHKLIWEEANGRKMPAAHVIRYADHNPNNLDPSNLVLATRNDVCRENQAAALLVKSRGLTALLLNRSQIKTPDEYTNTIATLRAR